MSDDINWDDPAAVAAARGDGAKDTDVDDKGKDADALDDAKKQEDEAAAQKAKDEAKAADDGKAGDDKAGDKEGGDKEPLIPKSRLDSKNRQLEEEREARKDLERKLAEADARDAKATKTTEVNLQAQRVQVLNDTVSELDVQINDALADGKRDTANALRQEQRNMEREIMRIEMREGNAETQNKTLDEMRLDLTIDQVEEMYPQLDPEADNYDAKLVGAVQELRGGFIATGKYSASQALLKAVAVYIPEDERIKEAPSADTSDETEAQKKARQAQKEAGLKKSTDAAGKQPPDLKTVGEDADTAGIRGEVDGSKLTLEDLEKMPMDQLKKLRGDYL